MKSGGEGGIRTLGTGVSPYNGLANRRIRPLCHLSGVPRSFYHACIASPFCMAAKISAAAGLYFSIFPISSTVECVVASEMLTSRQQHPLFEMSCGVGVGGGMRIVRHHHNGLMEVFVQAL